MLRVQPAFLRRLDSEDLISPERSDGGQRRYTRSEIDQIHRVSELAGEGLTLAGIRRLLALEAEVGQLKREVARLRAAQGSPRQGETGSSHSDLNEETSVCVSVSCGGTIGLPSKKRVEPVGSFRIAGGQASPPSVSAWFATRGEGTKSWLTTASA